MKLTEKNNPASLQNRFCFTTESLQGYCDGSISSEERSQIAKHLNIEKCQRCRQLYLLITGDEPVKKNVQTEAVPPFLPNEKPDILARLKNRQRPQTSPIPITVKKNVEKGQIWTTSPNTKTLPGDSFESVEGTVPVLIVDSGTGEKKLSNIIRVMPLSFDIGYNCSGKTYLFDGSAPTDFPFLVEIFNERAMLAGNLGHFKRILPLPDLAHIETLLNRYRSDKKIHILDPQADLRNSDLEWRQWQEKEFSLCRYLTAPVNVSPMEKEYQISVLPYKKAADGGAPTRINVKKILLDNKDCLFSVIQKTERILLRFFSTAFTPDQIIVDGHGAKIKKTSAPGEFEVEVGTVGHLPHQMVVKLVIFEEGAFEFTLEFKDSSTKET